MSASNPLTISDVQEAAERIRGKVQRTPILESRRLSQFATQALQAGSGNDKARLRLIFKCENMQTTGCFKFRGVTNFMLGLSDAQLKRARVSSLSFFQTTNYKTLKFDIEGNHAQATAYTAQTLGEEKGFAIKCTMVMPENAPPAKVEAARRLGASVVVRGSSLPECIKIATQIEEETGATFVPPSGHAEVVSGQGTAMLEFLQQLEDTRIPSSLDAVIMPAAGAGLLAGAATVCKDLPIRVYGAEPVKGGAGLRHSRRRGQRATSIDPFLTIADGLRSPTSEYTWNIVKHPNVVNGVYAASDPEVKMALRYLLEEMKVLVEPAAAVPLAVVLFNTEFQRDLAGMQDDWTVGLILSGGNTTIKKMIQMYS
ncbi:MAG: hypothetical protein Q9208_004686 [Pyrenodesmia sp. 3 TL-2023]